MVVKQAEIHENCFQGDPDSKDAKYYLKNIIKQAVLQTWAILAVCESWNLHGRTTPPLPLQLWGSWLPWSPAKEFTRVYHKLITDSPQWLWDKPLRKLVSAKNKGFFFFLPTRNSLNSFLTSGMFCWCIIETELYDSEFYLPCQSFLITVHLAVLWWKR